MGIETQIRPSHVSGSTTESLRLMGDAQIYDAVDAVYKQAVKNAQARKENRNILNLTPEEQFALRSMVGLLLVQVAEQIDYRWRRTSIVSNGKTGNEERFSLVKDGEVNKPLLELAQAEDHLPAKTARFAQAITAHAVYRLQAGKSAQTGIKTTAEYHVRIGQGHRHTAAKPARA